MSFNESLLEPETNNISTFAIEEFLAAEEAKDLLRFSTAGSVDDGKSTLIGRLLYDSRNVYEDQVRAVTGKQIGAGSGEGRATIDFALLTDGLRAEREQGITIDVAYRYFATQRRKFIIADTPGHEQYTRNMATGASTADLAIILIDARKGILTQSRRHAYIASLLGIRHLVAAVNKMDLVNFSEDVYRTIERDFAELVKQYGNASLTTIPVSALDGDNVVERSTRTPWYAGPSLLEHLEQVPVWTDAAGQPFRMAVQRVIRPDQHYRGFAGQIASGTLRPGDTIVALPSGRTSRVTAITTFDGDLAEATAPLSIAFTLEDELDISRGDIITTPGSQPQQATALEASLVWFDANKLETHHPYLLKHGSATVPARVTRVQYRTNIHTLAEEAVHSLGMNDVGTVELELTRSLFFDAYTQNRATGSFILIDPHTNATLAAGMIRRGLETEQGSAPTHASALVVFTAASTLPIAEVEHQLLEQGALVVRTAVLAEKTLRALLALGLIVLVEGDVPAQTLAALAEFNTLEARTFVTPEEVVAQSLRRPA
ncbi:sulfate adenylyltransferase subunit CysN [Granulicella sp. 5B5]|uniref:sulfate adenylyltransferase subunit CysN n=1 Tax=Granulicella sp. 5B5 TaxID=1617967 RepID=UPI0015F693FB|nr:sulfate adenylyltransferase subunit CysN [Granulicella sp. 5B5]QMV19433.1 sulfate adenylyltransferase subunit CysN [Granulicella sp. 5B5]